MRPRLIRRLNANVVVEIGGAFDGNAVGSARWLSGPGGAAAAGERLCGGDLRLVRNRVGHGDADVAVAAAAAKIAAAGLADVHLFAVLALRALVVGDGRMRVRWHGGAPKRMTAAAAARPG